MRICWAQYALWGVIALFGVGAMLSGCGQKGPLFLPDDLQAEKQRIDDERARERSAAEAAAEAGAAEAEAK